MSDSQCDPRAERTLVATLLLAGVLAADSGDPRGYPPSEGGKSARVRYAIEMADRLLAELAK